MDGYVQDITNTVSLDGEERIPPRDGNQEYHCMH